MRHAQPPTTALLLMGVLGSSLAFSRVSRAESGNEVQVISSTYLRMFQRALLPGPAGSQVSTRSSAPVYEYFALRAQRTPAPWGGEVSVELSAWGNGLLNNIPGESRFDGDVSVFSVSQRFGPLVLRLGRQVVTGGAARFSRLDGVATELEPRRGWRLEAYGGLQVLPRWSQRPGYQQLGSATDALIRSSEWIADQERTGYGVWGGRASYRHGSWGQLGLSYHEQREQSELGRRDAAADLVVLPNGPVVVSGLALLDVDSGRLGEARAAVDVPVGNEFSVTGEFRRTEPALFLSRQSVLSVFSTSSFDEAGGEVRYRPLPALGLYASAYWTRFDEGGEGGRGTLRVQASPIPRLFVQTVFSRVTESENGYYSVRASIRYRWSGRVSTVAEHDSYFYDKPIRGFATSTVDAGNLEWILSRGVRMLVGGSASRSPYAAFDAQGVARLICAFDGAAGGLEP